MEKITVLIGRPALQKESKSFIEWIHTYNKKPLTDDKKKLFEELRVINKNKSEFRNQIYLIKKYMGYIRKNFDHLTIADALETVNFDTDATWGIHKLLFHAHDKTDVWDFIEQLLDEKEKQIIDKI